ncbi:hypothetical protein V6N13_064888 [Hibiscus sabdariffa]|uniref:Uncharacterized protein n=1 Tax=Hibiscus sabdariffa TaxID=183260 RepID=A0ABR2ECY0_9ROSI
MPNPRMLSAECANLLPLVRCCESNYDKSTPRTDPCVSASIQSFFGHGVVSAPERYLGLVSIVGRSSERMLKHVPSTGGKEVFLT